MRTLMRMCGVAKLVRVRNERIRGTTKVEYIYTSETAGRRLERYGYIMRENINMWIKGGGGF